MRRFVIIAASLLCVAVPSRAKINKVAFESIDETTYDAIVVGAGTSGCMAAQTLGEGGHKTLLIEKGFDIKELEGPLGLASSLVAAPSGMINEDMADVIFTNKGVPYVVAKTLGGTAAISMAAYIEEDASYFDTLLQDYGVEIDELEWNKATEYIRNSGILSPAPKLRPKWFHDWVIADKMNREINDKDGNAPLSYSLHMNNIERTYSLMNPETQERLTSCAALKNPNVSLVQRTSVQSVVFDDLGPAHVSRATCVMVTQAGSGEEDVDTESKVCVRSGGRIILAAGVVHTPAILMRSGIGDSEKLAELGIKPILHNSDVGVGFHDKAISSVGSWPIDEEDEKLKGFSGSPRSFNSRYGVMEIPCDNESQTCLITMGELTGGSTFAVYAGLLAQKRSRDSKTSSLFRTVLKSQAVQLYARVRTRVAKDLEDLHTYTKTGKNPPKEGPIVDQNDKFTNLVECSRKNVATTVFLSDPKSRGFVSLDSNLDPTISDVYFSDGGQDMKDMIAAVIHVGNHLSEKPLFDWISKRGKSCLIMNEAVMLKAMLSSPQRTDIYPKKYKPQPE
eukprot:Selendium_serpulae@DN5337_c0_g2_i1.p1